MGRPPQNEENYEYVNVGLRPSILAPMREKQRVDGVPMALQIRRVVDAAIDGIVLSMPSQDKQKLERLAYGYGQTPVQFLQALVSATLANPDAANDLLLHQPPVSKPAKAPKPTGAEKVEVEAHKARKAVA